MGQQQTNHSSPINSTPNPTTTPNTMTFTSTNSRGATPTAARSSQTTPTSKQPTPAQQKQQQQTSSTTPTSPPKEAIALRFRLIGPGVKNTKYHATRVYYQSCKVTYNTGDTQTFSIGDIIFSPIQDYYAQIVEFFSDKDQGESYMTLRWLYSFSDLDQPVKAQLWASPKKEDVIVKGEMFWSDHTDENLIASLGATKKVEKVSQDIKMVKEGATVIRRYFGSSDPDLAIRWLRPGELRLLLDNPTVREMFKSKAKDWRKVPGNVRKLFIKEPTPTTSASAIATPRAATRSTTPAKKTTPSTPSATRKAKEAQVKSGGSGSTTRAKRAAAAQQTQETKRHKSANGRASARRISESEDEGVLEEIATDTDEDVAERMETEDADYAEESNEDYDSPTTRRRTRSSGLGKQSPSRSGLRSGDKGEGVKSKIAKRKTERLSGTTGSTLKEEWSLGDLDKTEMEIMLRIMLRSVRPDRRQIVVDALPSMAEKVIQYL